MASVRKDFLLTGHRRFKKTQTGAKAASLGKEETGYFDRGACLGEKQAAADVALFGLKKPLP